MNKAISRAERALLTLAVAQRHAGNGQTPSARTLRRAHREAKEAVRSHGVSVMGGEAPVDNLVNKICGRLSGICGEDDDELGSFWSRVKDAATKVAPVIPYVGPAIQYGGPAVKALAAKGGDKKTVAQNSNSKDENLMEVVGSELEKVENYTYLFGDEYAALEGAGNAEAEAFARHHGRHHRKRHAVSGEGLISHDHYRAAVLRVARKIAGGANPTAIQLAQADAHVKNRMAAKGLSVAIPGARPGRVTR